MKILSVGFIGIGVMGAPMAGHLANAGHRLIINDINRSNAERLVGDCENIRIADSYREIAEASDIVITMLPSGVYVNEVALGRDGLINGFRPGSLLLDTSSSEPWLTVETAEALAKCGVEMVDAAVSGALAGALSAELVFMVGGNEKSVSKAMPLLNLMGKKIFHLGPLGSGHAMKSINNLITAMSFMATAEGLVLGKKLGLNPEIMTDVLNVSTGMSWISKTHIKQRITTRKFDDPFKLDLMVKDIGIAVELANQQGLPVPFSALGRQLWKAAGQYSKKDSSISHMVSWVEHMSQTKITQRSDRSRK